MNRLEHISVLMAATLFAIGAVVVIVMQHNSATARVIGSLGGNASAGGVNANASGGLGVSASLAGTPTVGMAGSSANPAVVPLNINPGYLLN
jgi:hypothetical protein